MYYSRNRFLFNEGTPSGDGGAGAPNTNQQGSDSEVKSLREKLEAIQNNSQKILNEKKELEGKLKAIEDAKKIEEGKTSDILKEREAELEKLKAEQAALKTKAEEAEKFVNETRTELITQLPEELRDIADEIKDLTKLRKFVNSSIKQPPQTDDGKGAGGGVKLTELEKAEMEMLGISSEEDYLYIKSKRKK